MFHFPKVTQLLGVRDRIRTQDHVGQVWALNFLPSPLHLPTLWPAVSVPSVLPVWLQPGPSSTSPASTLWARRLLQRVLTRSPQVS